MAEEACYVYAVARGLTGSDLADISGLRARPVRAVDHRGLSAVISNVDLAEFGDDALPGNLENLDWLAEVATTHDAVVNAAARVSVTAPLRLGTICLDDDRVMTLLDEWHDTIAPALDRIEGRMEWSVKAFTTSATSVDAKTAPAAATGANSGPGAGAAYLANRKAEMTMRQKTATETAALADALHARLAGHAVASRRLQPQDPHLSGYADDMILNGAYLVDDNRRAELGDAARELGVAYPAVTLDVRGPWPPYSFATLEEP